MKKIIITIFIFLITTLSAYAQTISRNETVYVSLDSHGKPQKTEVVTWLRTDSRGPAQDATALKGIKNIQGSETPSVSQEGVITFTAPAKDIFYSGTTSRDLPVTFDIKYKLNGKPVARSEISGRSGRLEMTINIRNRTRELREFTYKEIGTGKLIKASEYIQVPFVVMVSTDLDISQFNNISAPDGAYAVVGHTMKMNWMCFPYPEASVRLTSDINNAKIPSILFTVIPKFPALPEIDLEGKLNQIYSGVDSVGGYLTRLENGASQLADGQQQMLDALTQVNRGTSDLILASNAQIEMIGGAARISEGMGEKITPLTKIPVVSGEAGKAKRYMDIQKGLLDLASNGGPFPDDILAFLKEQGKEAPPVKEFPGIRVTADGISQLNKGSLAMIDGSKKLEAGTLELKTGISQVRQQGTDVIKNRIVEGADPLVRKLASINSAKRLANEYDRFAGRPGRVKSSVAFILKTPDE
ncbi:MAG TPA: hypothetical protein VIS94_13280 [Desulfomonilia bacterium]